VQEIFHVCRISRLAVGHTQVSAEWVQGAWECSVQDVKGTADFHVVPGLRMYRSVPVLPRIRFMASKWKTLLSPIIYFLDVKFEVLVSIKTELCIGTLGDSCQCCGGRCRTMFFHTRLTV
jgi:hypothetical protein